LAKYYSRYMIGVYGWPLYVLMNPCSFCPTVCCGCRTEGSNAVAGDNCCHGSLSVYLEKSGVAVDDVLDANLISDFGKVRIAWL
jgi:hypothetical protein